MTQKDPAAASKGKVIALARAAASALLTTALGGSASAATGGWVSTTITGSWSANTTYTCYSRVVGDTLELRIRIDLAGAPTSATLTINMPSGRAINYTKLNRTASTDGSPVVGTGSILDFGVGTFLAVPIVTSTSGDVVQVSSVVAADNSFAAVTQAAPITFASGDRINLYIQVPIT